MQIFLHGGASQEHRFDVGILKQQIKDAGVKKLAYVILAIKEPDVQSMWVKNGCKLNIPGVDIRLVSLESITTAQADIEWADGLFFNGGSQETLLVRLRDNELLEVIDKMVHSGGIKFIGGESAGAMVLGSRVIIGKNSVRAVVEGLGVLDDTIVDSHFSERDRLERLLAWRQKLGISTGIGLDEGVAWVITGAISTKVGRGSVTIINDDGTTVYD
jgi:cyanophycinase